MPRSPFRGLSKAARERRRRERKDYRFIARPLGAGMLALSLTSLAAAIVGGLWDALDPRLEESGSRDAFALILTSVAVAALGLVLYQFGGKTRRRQLDRRGAILTVVILWSFAGLVGALPFYFGHGLKVEDAIFESFSGLTTTGATVLPTLEGAVSRTILLYRSLLQWLGGVGIVVLFAALFPKIGAAGKRLFRDEAPARGGEPIMPRIRELSLTIWAIYSALTALLFFILIALGMDAFSALCHAMSTLATGGFSTRDAAIAAFDSLAIELVITAFMLIGAINFGLYYQVFKRRSLRPLIRNIEARVFIAITFVAWLIIAWTSRGHYEDITSALRHSLFIAAGTISSTGFAYELGSGYPAAAQLILLGLMFIGGCAGSTAGGLKIERVLVLYQLTTSQIRKSFRPHAIEAIRIGRRALDPNAVAAVVAIFILYLLTIFIGTLVLTLLEPIEPAAAFGAVLSAVTNAGLAPLHSSGELFSAFTGVSKLALALLMLLGRLEFLAFFALFVPRFWRR